MAKLSFAFLSLLLVLVFTGGKGQAQENLDMLGAILISPNGDGKIFIECRARNEADECISGRYHQEFKSSPRYNAKFNFNITTTAV